MVRFWDMESGQELFELRTEGALARGLAISGNGTTIAAYAFDKILRDRDMTPGH